MEGSIAVVFIFLFGGLILFVAALCGGFSGVTHSTNSMPEHNYTEEEFIALFNYCINKRNAKTHEQVSIITNQKISNMDAILDYCCAEYEQSYHSININDLCRRSQAWKR